MKLLQLIVALLLCIGIFASTTESPYTTNDNDDPLPTGGAACTANIQCNYPDGGECVSDNTTGEMYCVCNTQYADPDCSYHRKSRSVAAGLEWLCLCSGGGAGDFYLGRDGEGGGQFVLCLPMIFIVCGSFCLCCSLCGHGSCSCECKGAGAVAVAVCLLLMALAGVIWSIIEFALILKGDVLDGNGYALRD